ncbi:MAG: helix-turn-helix transcriptional regulator [Streptosporangiaceae bacterium]|nr:helix-turn-helix transcriptional regulator [Streptosporangiaceae bacterium]
MRERKMKQSQLAKAANVDAQTIRQMVRTPGKHQQNSRTLAALSVALGKQEKYLENVRDGRLQQQTAEDGADEANPLSSLESRMSAQEQIQRRLIIMLDQRLGNVVDVIFDPSSGIDMPSEIKDYRHDK